MRRLRLPALRQVGARGETESDTTINIDLIKAKKSQQMPLECGHLLVREDEQHRILQLVLIQHVVQLIARLRNTISIVAVM